MARPKTHKFAVRTSGLNDEQAAQLAYAISHVAWAVSDGRSEFGTNLSTSVLRDRFPDVDWRRISAKQRVALVE